MAEVLITLAVIGVVAALTIPTLIQSYQKKVTVTKLEKAYTDISKAVIAAQAEHGMMSDWSGLENLDGNQNFLENYIGCSLKSINVCGPTTNECFKENAVGMNGEINTELKGIYPHSVSIITQNGYSILFGVNTEYIVDGVRIPHAQFRIDLDGPNKGENMIGKDVFGIICYFKKIGHINPGCYLSGVDNGFSREELLNNKTNGCNKNSTGLYCGALIQADGWQIKDDYPW